MTKIKKPKKSKRQLDHVVRRFYNVRGFMGGTDYLEWRGVKRGGMFIVSKEGVAVRYTDWKLKRAVGFVKEGVWYEKSA